MSEVAFEDEQRLRAVLDSLGEGVVVQDIHGRVRFLNVKAQEILGVEAPDVIGRTSADIGWSPLDETGRPLGPDSHPGFASLAQGTPVTGVLVQHDRPGGERRWLEVSSYPLASGGRAPDSLVTVIHDVTDRREDAASLRTQATVLDSVGQAVILVGVDQRVRYWNRAAEELYGWSAKEAVGRNVLELTTYEDQASYVEEITSALLRGESWSGDFWSRHRDGTRFPVLVTDTPVFGDDGELVAIIGVSTDITERVAAEAQNRRLSQIVQSSRDAIVGRDRDGLIVAWNTGARELYGYEAHEILGHHVSELVPEDRLDELTGLFVALDAGEDPGVLDTWRRRKDGSLVEVSLSLSPTFDEAGELVGGSSSARDITALRALERALEEDRRRLEEAQQIGKMGSFEIDWHGGKVVWSLGLHRLLGVDPETTPSLDLFRSLVHPDDQAITELAFLRAGEAGLPTTVEHRLILEDGTRLWVRSQGAPVADGRFVGIVLDLTERHEAEAALAHQDLHDTLTGLANRTLLEDRLTQAAARGSVTAANVTVLAIGIDRFTVVNEEMGRDAGDDLLIQFAGRLRAAARPTDTVARLAADEFFVVSDGSPSSRESAALAQSLQVTLAEPFTIQGREVSITASIGVVDLEPGNEPSQATRAATDAMGQAKLRGRAQIVSRQSGPLRTGLASRLDMANALGHALDRNELRVHYQPVIDLASSEVSGFEALVRWEHPERGLLLPGEFVQLAEDTGLILSIGGWVLGKAIRQLAAWRAEGATLTMAVNISAHQLRTGSLLTTLSRHLDQHRVPADVVHLEITETVLMDDVFNSIERLTTLRSTGVRIDIDDFGTGYSSLSYLRRLPINGLKVDQSFVDGLGHDEDDSAIAHAIVGLGLALHLDVIAEGVETEAQAQQLRALGCPSAQGYLWSPALPPEEAVSLIGSDIARPR